MPQLNQQEHLSQGTIKASRQDEFQHTRLPNDDEQAPLTFTSERQQHKPQSPGRTPPGESIATTVIACLLALVLVMGYFLHTRLAALEANAGGIDNILVIDYQSIFAGFPEDVTGEQANEILNQVHERILALQDAGYIVLDSGPVLAAPSELRIDGSLLLEGEAE